MRSVITLFGEAEKGAFKKGYLLKEIPQLMDQLGNPPPESQGLFFAIQALLFERELLYFRVEEEGFSYVDYFHGLQTLQKYPHIQIQALGMPGVGDPKILDAFEPIFHQHRSLLITNQKDLYDYLSSHG